jgi:hypothetical protein
MKETGARKQKEDRLVIRGCSFQKADNQKSK